MREHTGLPEGINIGQFGINKEGQFKSVGDLGASDQSENLEAQTSENLKESLDHLEKTDFKEHADLLRQVKNDKPQTFEMLLEELKRKGFGLKDLSIASDEGRLLGLLENLSAHKDTPVKEQLLENKKICGQIVAIL